MIKYIKADLTDQKGVIIHGCNAQGVMNSGVARAIRTAFPEAFMAYSRAYVSKGLHLGDIICVKYPNGITVVNAITQLWYGREPNVQYVDYDAIRTCLTKVKEEFPEGPYFLPLIGCGLGGGSWLEVEPIIKETLGEATICEWS